MIETKDKEARMKHSHENNNKNNKMANKGCREMCSRREIQLKEAEKTIANKDVIIKMLQEQVKKLGETYKHNLKSTEEFRFKYCKAAEQIKRLQNNKTNLLQQQERISRSPACMDSEIRIIKELAKCPQQCGDLYNKEESSKSTRCDPECEDCEKFMQEHYDMLRCLTQKIAQQRAKNEKDITAESSTDASETHAKCPQITKLLDEIANLKRENENLRRKKQNHEAEAPIPEEVEQKPSTAKKQACGCGNAGKKIDGTSSDSYSSYMTAQECENSPPTLVNSPLRQNQANCLGQNRRVSFHEAPATQAVEESITSSQLTQDKVESIDSAGSSKPTSNISDSIASIKSCTCPMNKCPMKPLYSESDKDVDNQSADKTSEGHCTCGDKCPYPSLATNSGNNADLDVKSNTTDSGPVVKTETVISDPLIVNTLKQINDKVDILTEKEQATQNELGDLKEVIADFRKRTESYNDQMSKIKETVQDHQLNSMLKFNENRSMVNSLIEENGKVQMQLNEIKARVEILYKKVENIKKTSVAEEIQPTSDRKISDNEPSDSCLTIDECKLHIDKLSESTGASMIPHMPSYSEHSANKSLILEDTSADQHQHGNQSYNMLKEHYTDLKREQDEKDRQIQWLKDLITYYKKVNKEIVDMNLKESVVAAKNQDQTCTDNGEDDSKSMDYYFDRIVEETCKLKNTISTVIDDLKVKISQLSEFRDAELPEVKSTTVEYISEPPVTPIKEQERSVKVSDGCACCSRPAASTKGSKKNEGRELEDIYNDIRCACMNVFDKPEAKVENDIRKNNQLLCSCSFICDKTAKRSNQSASLKEKLDDLPSVLCPYVPEKFDTSSKDVSIARTEDTSCDCSVSESFMDAIQNFECVCHNCPVENIAECKEQLPQLKNYLDYLQNQLDVITGIENEMDDFRGDLKTKSQ